MIEHWRWFFRTLMYFLSPAFVRFFFKGQQRMAFYLEGGQVVKFNCTHVITTLNGGNKSYSIEGLFDSVTFDAGKIIAVKEVAWW